MNPAGYVPKTEWLVRDWHHATITSGTLCVQCCTACGHFRHPPRRFCSSCASAESAFVSVAGTGTVYTYLISHRSLDPAWNERVPFVTVVVELDEGPRVLAGTDLTPGSLAINDRVRISIERRSDDFAQLWTDRYKD